MQRVCLLEGVHPLTPRGLYYSFSKSHASSPFPSISKLWNRSQDHYGNGNLKKNTISAVGATTPSPSVTSESSTNNKEDFSQKGQSPSPNPLKNNTVQKDRELILRRLEDSHGIRYEDRREAFMLGTQKQLYPLWVHQLPSPSLKWLLSAQSLNLKSIDLRHKSQLAMLPVKKRVTEFSRREAARRYEHSDPSAERPQLRQDHNKYRASREAYARQRMLDLQAMVRRRREMLGLPPRYSAVPTRRVDYSRRLARLATHLLEGHKSRGVYPPMVRKTKYREKREPVPLPEVQLITSKKQVTKKQS